ncbi:MAG: AbrB/MazE/SpoVT family DNA-binding domain-containing protein [Thaumarchaeota archaeon]|nr:AbrB/MazE/SpoVT family DNA-binding domain-containing protein [Nitrososphaerota archaeon]MCL5316780.1 AbrB/MazE/SpoVT family DNA-binding domain-containing protein [Nitrososphaerota archaeon]
MTTAIKVREKGIVVLPKELREKAGIKEGSIVVATAFDDGIILSPKETDVLAKLLGLAKVSKKSRSGSTGRIRSLRQKIDKEEEQTLSSK